MHECRPPSRPSTCAEVSAQLDDFIDRELSTDEMHCIQEHVDRCAECAAENRFERAWIGSVRTKLQRIELPAELALRITRRLAELAGEPPTPHRH